MRRRLNARDDRGAAAVAFALMMTVLLLAAGLAIDVGSWMHHKQLLRNGADAAAMAIAQECGAGPCSEEQLQQIADEMVAANAIGTDTRATVVADPLAGTVRVDAHATHRNSLAGLAGHPSTEIAAASAAEWGYPTSVNAVLPYALSMCVIEAQDGITAVREGGKVVGFDIPASATPVTLNPEKQSISCQGNDGKTIPGGYGWLVPDSGCGETLSVVKSTVSASMGNTPPANCDNSDFEQWIGKLVLVPVFDKAEGKGDKATYTVLGHIGFRLSGYYLAGQYDVGAPCGTSTRCMTGTFERFVSLSEDITVSPDGPKLGAAVARFIQP